MQRLIEVAVNRIHYSVALRAIGQVLEAHGASVFDLKREEDDDYFIQCDSDTLPPNDLLSFRYGDQKIRELDQLGQRKRNVALSGGEVDALSNVLRAIGSYIARRSGRLIGISNLESIGVEAIFRTEFETPEGRKIVENQSESEIHNLCIEMRKERKKLAKGSRRMSL